MPTLVAIGRLRIRMYLNDHNPPHFHILTPDHAAVVSIETLEILAGYLPASDLRVALRWARENRELLIHEWNRLSSAGSR